MEGVNARMALFHRLYLADSRISNHGAMSDDTPDQNNTSPKQHDTLRE